MNTTEPKSFAAGETLNWRKALTDYPASEGWALAYKFRGPGPGFDADATADGDDFLVTVTAVTTSALAGGTWYWQGWVSLGADTYQVSAGQAEVSPTLPSEMTPYDGRSVVKRTLDALDAMILGKASLDQKAYTINNRSLERYAPAELLEWRAHYARLYAQEQTAARAAQGDDGFFPRTVLTRFTKPSL